MKKIKSCLVHIGCGLSVGESWLNFDSSPTLFVSKVPIIGMALLKLLRGPKWPRQIRYGDIVKGLPLAKKNCKMIFCSHVLEHLSLADFHKALGNIYNYLEPEGILRLIVPDLEVPARQYLSDLGNDNCREKAAVSFLKKTCLGCEMSRVGVLRRLRETAANSRHQWLWDKFSLSSALKEHGFREIKTCKYGEWSSEKFLEVENEDRHNGSVCLEAKK